MTTPLRLPIFPLPDLTFFPHTLLPLHVFEARYRSMISDSMARDRRIAVVALEPGYEKTYDGRPAVRRVAGVGRIVRCERLSNGRFNILLRGDQRVRIERELPADTLYRFVEATPLDEVGGDGPEAQALGRAVGERCLQILETLGRSSKETRESIASVRSPAELGDQVASAVIPDPALRQALLEELDVEKRLRRLGDALDDLFQRLSRGR